VVVTGGSSGIGRAIALAFASSGHPVAVAARRLDRCEAVAAEIRELGGEAVGLHVDLADDDSVKLFAAAATAAIGEIEVVISNAAVLQPGRVSDVDSSQFGREIDVNLVGAHRLVTAFVPAMIERRRGDVVFVSSDVAVQVRPFMSSYAAGKWGLEGMVRSLQLELEGFGVRASLVRPGPTKSDMGGDWDPQDMEMVINNWVRFGLARHGLLLRPPAVADAVLAVVRAPRGVHLNLIEVSPEAPVEGP
jgi:NAD(P)-dependent dehydrogenase (short-subunit alcohol dehydrogenase family)